MLPPSHPADETEQQEEVVEHNAPPRPKPPPPQQPPRAQEAVLRKEQMEVLEIKGFSKEDVWKRTGIGTGYMFGVREKEANEKEQEQHVVVEAEKKGCATADEQQLEQRQLDIKSMDAGGSWNVGGDGFHPFAPD